MVLTVENNLPTITSLVTTPSVVAEGDSSATLTITGTGFIDATTVSVGGISRSATTSSSTQMILTLTSGDLDSAGKSPVTAINPTPGGGTSISVILPIVSVHDSFTASNGTTLSGRTPNASPGSATWGIPSPLAGTWTINSNTASETVGADLNRRVVVDGGASDVEVTADVTWNSRIVGLVIRQADESNWVMGWWDGSGNLFIGQLASSSFGVTKQTSGFSWGSPGDTHKMTLTANGDNVTLLIEGVGTINGTLAVSTTNTGVGMFNRDSSTNTFDNFIAVPLAAP